MGEDNKIELGELAEYLYRMVPEASKNDENIQIGASDKTSETDMFFFHNRSFVHNFQVFIFLDCSKMPFGFLQKSWTSKLDLVPVLISYVRFLKHS